MKIITKIIILIVLFTGIAIGTDYTITKINQPINTVKPLIDAGITNLDVSALNCSTTECEFTISNKGNILTVQKFKRAGTDTQLENVMLARYKEFVSDYSKIISAKNNTIGSPFNVDLATGNVK